jgi:uncharacterized protein YdaT
MRFVGKVDKDGVLRIVNRAYFDKFLKDELSEKEVTIEIKKKTRQRSNVQNGYYHSCVIPILRNAFKDIGHNLSNEEVHLFLKNKFLKISMANENGEFIGEKIGSTADLTTTQFMEYIQQIQQFAAESLDVVIPDPLHQVQIEID